MEAWVKKIVEKEKKKRNVPLEVKKIGKNYYLYHSTTVWVKEEGRRRKVSNYIGRITEKGVVTGTKRTRYVRSIYEYGNVKFLYEISQEILPALREAFPDEYKEILAMAIVKVIQPVPIKLIKGMWERMYLTRHWKVSLSGNSISDMLKRVGGDWSAQMEFFRTLLRGKRYLLFDLSSVVSYSKNLRLAEKGYNAEGHWLKQINFALLFSVERGVPVMLNALPGAVRDIKALKRIIEGIGISSCVMVLDRGFASYTLGELMEERGIKFILPVRRNFKVIDYELQMEGSFIYCKRGINWAKKEIQEGLYLYLFEDVKLRAEEETTFIEMVSEGRKNREDMLREMKKFGKIGILSNMEVEPEEIYLLYKERESVEVAFDAFKNELESDKVYLSDDDKVKGYFFVSFVSLYLFFRIMEILRTRGMLSKMSVKELLFELSKVYLVHYSDEKDGFTEIPAKVEKLDKALGLNLFPKILRS